MAKKNLNEKVENLDPETGLEEIPSPIENLPPLDSTKKEYESIKQTSTPGLTPDIPVIGIDLSEQRKQINEFGDRSFDLGFGSDYMQGQYDKAITAEKVGLAEGQGFWGETLGFLNQAIVGEIIGGTVEGIGYLFDFEHWGSLISGGEGDWGNWLSDMGSGLKEWTREATPIHVNPEIEGTFSPGNWEWWMSNGVSVASVASVMIPAAGWVRGIGMAGSALGTAGKVVNAIGKTSKLGKGISKYGKSVHQAVVSRHIENMMEANGVNQEQYAKFKQAGFSDEEAKERASKAAANVYGANWAMIAQDIPQYLLLGRGMKSTRDITSRRVAKAANESQLKAMSLKSYGIGKDMVSEGMEEAYQYIVSEEAKHFSDVSAGLKEGSEWTARYKEYFASGELQTAAFFGGLGAGVMQTVGAKVNNAILNRKGISSEEEVRIDEIKDRGTKRAFYAKQMQEAAQAGDSRAYEQARTNAAVDIGLSASKAGNLGLAIQEIEAFQAMSPEARAANGLTEEFSSNLEEAKQDLIRVGELFEQTSRKFDDRFVGPIVESRFLIEKLGKQRPQMESEVAEAEAAFPRIHNLSPVGRQVFDLEADMRTSKQNIRQAEFIIKNKKKMTPQETEHLEQFIAEQKEFQEAAESKLTEAREGELSDMDRKILKDIDSNAVMDPVASAKSKIDWADHMLDSHVSRLNKLSNKEYWEAANTITAKRKEDGESVNRLKEIYSQVIRGSSKESRIELQEGIPSLQETEKGLSPKEKNALLKEAKGVWESISKEEREQFSPILEEMQEIVDQEKDIFSAKRKAEVAAAKNTDNPGASDAENAGTAATKLGNERVLVWSHPSGQRIYRDELGNYIVEQGEPDSKKLPPPKDGAPSKVGSVQLSNKELETHKIDDKFYLVFDQETLEPIYTDDRRKPNLDIVANPNVGADAEVKFVVDESGEWWQGEKDNLDPENYWTKVPVYAMMKNPDTGEFETVGKIKAGEGFEDERRLIYNNYLQGKETLGGVEPVTYNYTDFSNITSVSNLRNVADDAGVPKFQSVSDAFATAWQETSTPGEYVLKRNDAPLHLFTTAGSTRFFVAEDGGAAEPRLDLDETSPQMREDLSTLKLVDAEGHQDGQVWTAVLNPSGKWVPVKLSTSNLSPKAVDKVMGYLSAGNFADAKEIVYAEYENDQASFYESFLQFAENRATGEKFIKFKENGIIYSISQKDFQAAVNAGGTASVQEETIDVKEGKTTLSRSGNTIQLDVADKMRNILAGKKYNVKAKKLRSSGQYTSPVTGQLYSSYETYLAGGNTVDGVSNTEVEETATPGRPSTILATDVKGNNGNFFFDIGMQFNLVEETVQSETQEDATDETDKKYSKGHNDSLFDDFEKPFGDFTEGDIGDVSDEAPFSLTGRTQQGTISINEASNWLNKRGLSFNKAKQVLSVSQGILPGTEGVFESGLVYLADNASAGTEYHEAFHAIFRMYLTDAQQKSLLEESEKNSPISEAELSALEAEGYYSLTKDGKIMKNLLINGKPGRKEISMNELKTLILEERLAEEFRAYVASNQKQKPTNSKIAKFVRDLWNFIKTYFSSKRTIDQLFSNIESGRINRTRVNERFASADPINSLKNNFSTQEQEEIVSMINSAFLDIKDRTEEAGLELDAGNTYEAIRNHMLKSMFYVTDASGNKTLPTFETAKKHYDMLSKGTAYYTQNKEAGVNVNGPWKVLGSIYKNWNNVEGEYGNIDEFGWLYLAKRQLSKYGLKIYGDLAAQIDDQIEKNYSKTSVEESRKDSLSGPVKQFLSRIVAKDVNGQVVTNIIGTETYIPFDSIYQEVALTVINSTTFNDLLNKLGERGLTNEGVKSVHEALIAEVNNDNYQFLAQFYKNMTMTYIDFVGAIEEVDVVELEGGEKDITIKIRYFNSNNNRLAKVLKDRWRENSRRPDNKGLFIKDADGTASIDQKKLAIMQEAMPHIKEIKSSSATPQDHHVNAMVNFMNAMGVDITKPVLVKVMDAGIKINNRMVQGGALYRYLWDGASEFSNNNVGLEVLLKNVERGLDPHEVDSRTLDRFIRVAEQFEEATHGSFLNGAGKSIYPINMHTTLTRQFSAYKSYDPKKTDFWNDYVRKFTEDTYYFPEGPNATASKYNGLFISEILSETSNFRNTLRWEDFDVYKTKDEVGASKHTYDSLTELTTKLHRLNSFINNGNKQEMRVVMPTLADRNKMMLLTIPRISYNEKLHGYRNKSVQEIYLGYIVQDLARVRKVHGDIATKNPKTLVKNYHTGAKRGLMFTQFEFLNETTVGRELLEFAIQSADEQLLYTSNEITELFDKALVEIDRYIDRQVSEQTALLEELGVNKKKGRKKVNPIDPVGMALYDNNLRDLLRDFVAGNLIAKNEIIKMTAGDLAFYKDYEDFSKRYGGMATPGYEAFQEDFGNSVYGDQSTYKMVVINDVYKLDTAALDGLAAIAGEEAVKAYREGSNKTDAMGYTTLEKHMRKMMGQGTWTDNHQKAYDNYRVTEEFSFKNKEGQTIRPLLSPIKTYHDGMYLIDGRMTRVLVKHATFPLLKEFTKNLPAFESLRQAMQDGRFDEANHDSAVKVGLHGNLEVIVAEDGSISNLDELYPIELNTHLQRIPQVIPENKTKDPQIGSQLMKLIVSNLKENLDGTYNVGGTELTGAEMLKRYHEVIEKMIENGKNNLYREIGYSDYLASSKDKAAKLEFLKNLRLILRKSAEERNLPDNYIKVLNIKETLQYVDALEEEVSTYDFAVPLSHPVFQSKFEQIIFSLFKNNLMRLSINGESLVQIAELGGHKTDGELKFVTNDNGAIKHAEVAIPWKLATKLGLPKDENGEYDLSNIPDDVRTMVGYRIPTQGKNSMLPLYIKRVLPPAMGKAILVPGEITTQMGSDFDVDKLFLMMTNYDSYMPTADGGEFNEMGAFAGEMKAEGFELTNKELSKLLRDTRSAEDILRYDQEDLEDAVLDAKSFIRGKKAELGVGPMTARKLEYDLNDLDPRYKRELENAYKDIVEAVLTSPAHAAEMLATVDSKTIPDQVAFIKEKTEGLGGKLDPQNIQTEETLEARNKTGKTGIGIYANALTGQTVRQYSDLAMNSKYAVRFDGGDLTDLTVVRDQNGNLISYLFNKHLNISVDNAKDPMMDVINDNPFTSPVTNLIISTGPANKALAVKGTDLTGEATEVAGYFRTQPIILELTRLYTIKGATPAQLFETVNEIGRKYFGNDFSVGKSRSTVDINSVQLKDAIGSKVEDNPDLQQDVLTNFYHYHKAGRMLNKVNKAFNADRISDMSSMAAIEEFMETIRELYDETRNPIMTGFESVLEGEAFIMTRAYLGAINDALSFAEEFFPFSKDGIELAKTEIRNALNKQGLKKEELKAINSASMLHFVSQKMIPGPLSPLFSKEWEYKLLTGPNSIDVQMIAVKQMIREADSTSDLAKLHTNMFLNRLSSHKNNFKENTTHKGLSFDYNFTMSAFEHSRLSDDFGALLDHSDPAVRELGKNLVYYSILSKGFAPGADSFADIIPVEVWSDPGISLQKDKISVVTFLERHYNSFDNGEFFAGFPDEFIENNSHLRGLVPSLQAQGSRNPKKTEIVVTQGDRSIYNDAINDGHFSKYLTIFDNDTKEQVLYKKTRDRADSATYTQVENKKGVPFKLQQYNFTDAAGEMSKERNTSLGDNQKCK